SARYTDSAGTLRPPTTGAPTPTREGVRRMAPYEVAELALEGVRANQPYVLTHPESFAGIEARYVALRLAAEHAASRLGLAWPAASPPVQRREDSEPGSHSD